MLEEDDDLIFDDEFHDVEGGSDDVDEPPILGNIRQVDRRNEFFREMFP